MSPKFRLSTGAAKQFGNMDHPVLGGKPMTKKEMLSALGAMGKGLLQRWNTDKRDPDDASTSTKQDYRVPIARQILAYLESGGWESYSCYQELKFRAGTTEAAAQAGVAAQHATEAAMNAAAAAEAAEGDTAESAGEARNMARAAKDAAKEAAALAAPNPAADGGDVAREARDASGRAEAAARSASTAAAAARKAEKAGEAKAAESASREAASKA